MMITMRYTILKLKYITIALLLSANLFSQENLNLPNLTPPSPEAFAMTKYGDIPANEFTGEVNSSIPLYTYRAGHLELPISLNYSGAGVKVDQMPTWVGINWTLNAGGIVTRVVKDIPDETAVSQILFSNEEVIDYDLNTTDGTLKGEKIRNLVSNSQVDSEVDVFQFNFPGYSGSFYIDGDWKAKLLKDDASLKIFVGENRSSLYNDKIIKITTPEGIIYTFGGANATEDTTQRYVVNGSVQPDTYQGTTAFYLTSIEHPINGTILFEYESNLGQQILVTQKIQKRSKLISSSFMGTCDTSTPSCTNYKSTDDVSTSTTVSTRVLNPKYLKKIKSHNTLENISFNSTGIDNIYFKRVLNNIIVDVDTNSANEPFKTIDLEYVGFQSGGSPFGHQDVSKRFFLEKVIFDKNNSFSTNTQQGRRNEVYSFEYNGYSGLPTPFSFSQDFAGYFNGKANITGIPDHPTFNPFGLTNFADRTPDFSQASKGALTKIIYPTGGYTLFDYEAASKAKKQNFKSISLFAYRNQTAYSPTNYLNDGVPQLLADGTVYGISNVGVAQNVTINVSLKAFPNGNLYPTITPRTEKATLIVWDLGNIANQSGQITVFSSFEIEVGSPGSSGNGAIVEENQSFPYLFLEGHSYGMKIQIYNSAPEVYPSSPVPMEARVFLKYNNGYVVVEDLGVRLKRQSDFSKDDHPENIKRYYYSTMDNLSETVELSSLPVQGEGGMYIKTDRTIDNFFCNPTAGCGFGGPSFDELYYEYLNIYSDRFDYSSTPNAKFFKNVTISYGGDNFEKGGAEKEFSLYDNYGATKIDVNYGNYPRSITASMIGADPEVLNDYSIPSSLNGTLINEKLYKKDGSIVKKIIENVYVYSTTEMQRINNVFGKKEFEALLFYQPANLDNTASNYTVGTYPCISNRYELTLKKTTEYIDPIPLGAQDESIYKKIISNQYIEYGMLSGLPTKIRNTTSETDVSKIVRNYYPTDRANLVDLTPSYSSHYAKLENQNRVATPIQVETYLGTELLSTQRTLYKSWNSNPEHVMSEIIQSSKGDRELENRIVFTKYDWQGNPSEVALAGGAKTRYYFTSRNQLALKIENYSSPTGTGTELPDGEPVDIIPDDCEFHLMYPNSLVTAYKYNEFNQIVKITDANCLDTFYEYDALHRLMQIKNDDGDILKEFSTNFKRY